MTSPDYLVQLDLDGSGAFATDVTDDVTQLALSRGVSNLSGPDVRPTAGTAKLTLANGGAVYDPTNSAGPHYGLLNPRVPMRILGPELDRTSHLRTSRLGALVAPDSANLSVAGDLDLRVQVTFLPGIPGAGLDIFTDEVLLAGKLTSYSFRASPGALSASVRGADFPLANRTFAYQPGGALFPLGEPLWLRAFIDLNNGAGKVACTFYYSTDGVGWTTIASPADTSGLPHIPGAINDTGTTTQLAGDVVDVSAGVALHQVLLSDAGGAYCTLDLTDQPRRATTVVSPEGDTFTLTGSATIVEGTGRPCLFAGRVRSWDLDYPADGNHGLATLSCADAWDQLSAVELPADTPVTVNKSTGYRLAELLDAAPSWTGQLIADQGEPYHAGTTAEGSLAARLLDTSSSTGGDLWVDAEGRVVYRQRYGVLTNPGARELQLELTDQGAGIGYLPSVTVALDDARRVSRAVLSRDGAGTEVEVDDGTTEDVRTYARSDLNLATDDQVTRLAEHYVGTFATPRPRMGKVTIPLHALDAADQATVLVLDLGQRIGVTHEAPGAAPWVTEQVVRGIVDSCTEGTSPVWLRTLTVEDAGLYDRWVLGDPVLGVLGSTTRLA